MLLIKLEKPIKGTAQFLNNAKLTNKKEYAHFILAQFSPIICPKMISDEISSFFMDFHAQILV